MVLVIIARGGDLFTEAGSSLSVSFSLSLSACARMHVCVCVFRHCMKTPCRPLCHYNRFGSSFCKTEHAYPDHTHTPSCATRVALCGSHTPWSAEQRCKMAHKRDQYLTARQSSRSPIPLPPAIGHAETLRGYIFYLSSSPAPALGTIC